MKRRKRLRTLRFEGLETRLLLAGDLFPSQMDNALVDVCLSSAYAESVRDDSADLREFIGSETVLRTVLTDSDRGTPEEILLRDLAFADLGRGSRMEG